ncbi:hypothetical protein BH20ACT2_BH20ACT2_16440 [soil metagenome]
MDEHSGFKPPDDKPTSETAEGVRIIGAEEAAEAIERGDVVKRRGDDVPRYGDRPAPPPQGPRPALRFPLGAAADPTAIERPPVQPPPPIGRDDPPAPPPPVDLPPPAWEEPPWPEEPVRLGAPAAPGGWDDPPDPGVELPHWTAPATGEVPKILGGDDADDLDAWSSFSGNAPRWRDASTEHDAEDFADVAGLADDETRIGALDDSDRPSHEEIFAFDELRRDVGYGGEVDERYGDDHEDGYGDGTVYVPPSREEGTSRRAARRARAERGGPLGPGRDVPTAVGVGAAFAVAALILFRLGPRFAVVLVTAVVVLCAAELFNGLRRAGYQPATLLGLAATAALPLAVYWKGEAAFPLVMFLTVVFGLLWYLVGVSEEEPLVNLGVTALGVLWVGVLGSFAALILTVPSEGVSILLAAVLVTAGYDIGGFVVGRRMGRRPLNAVSPSKTVEGLAGGMLSAVFVAVIIVGAIPGIGPFGSVSDALLLGVAAAVAAPLGDLCESLVKRELGVKDMGSILPGHGGLLDRFDALLFVLPTTYYVVRLVLT